MEQSIYLSDRLCPMMVKLVNPNFTTEQHSGKGMNLTCRKKAEKPVIKTKHSTMKVF